MKLSIGVSRPDFPRLLNEKCYRRGVEIGVQDGDHADFILRGWSGSLILVDPWRHYDELTYLDMANAGQEAQEIHYRRCLTNTHKFWPRVEIMRMFSDEASAQIADNSLDFAYIDANHAYQWVMLDLISWWPKVRAGGMISGHDFTVDAPPREGNVFGVKPAVEDFVNDKGIEQLYVAEEEWPTWYFFKS